MYISLWENSRGHPDNDSFMQFSTKIDGFEQKYSQGFENSYNFHEQYPLEKFFIFTIYQNYTLALRIRVVMTKATTSVKSVCYYLRQYLSELSCLVSTLFSILFSVMAMYNVLLNYDHVETLNR